MKRFKLVLVSLLMFCTFASGALAVTLNTTAAGDGMVGRDWYSNPNYYWVDNASSAVTAYHDGSMRWWYRGMVIFDISSLAGMQLANNSATFNFYSLGFSNTNLLYGGATGSEVTTAYGQITGAYIDKLNIGEGWQSYDVTSFLQSGIDAGNQNVAFVFQADNYCGGNLASFESGSGSYLQVGSNQTAVPEPVSLLLLGLGLIGIAGVKKAFKK